MIRDFFFDEKVWKIYQSSEGTSADGWLEQFFWGSVVWRGGSAVMSARAGGVRGGARSLNVHRKRAAARAGAPPRHLRTTFAKSPFRHLNGF